MSRLFVDCDDTLIIYDNEDDGELHAYGYLKGFPYHLNGPLVSYIKWFAEEYPEELIVIWSGGGGDYARTIAERIFPGMEVATMIKDETTYPLVRENDIVVDDQDLPLPNKIHRPNGLPSAL
ncbi:hypothetical protein LCGC14_1624140 [marine sediment metagenome]|uniref:FCP1 homology domain-containing protein n=1 Tax=marine sediment metagenome TaxID=412755 RepID=A0A0F9I4U8_9ZZZZ